MKDVQQYRPVGCDFVDQIEIFATQKKQVDVTYDNGNAIVTEQHVLKTWETKNKEEFLITVSGLRIRLDFIHAIDGHANSRICSIPK